MSGTWECDRSSVADLDSTVDVLLERGYATVPLPPMLVNAARKALESGRRFFSLSAQHKESEVWSGTGMWHGYQPLPVGDAATIDRVERFEVTKGYATKTRSSHPVVAELLAAVRAVMDPALVLVESLVTRAALAVGYAAADARSIWIDGHESTVALNHYPARFDDSLAMKPHEDFAGLTLVFLDAGAACSLEFQREAHWLPLPHEASACAVVGELLGGWLGTPAPRHRVRSTRTTRDSLVFFHQPDFERTIPFKDGHRVAAREHIARRQAAYNELDERWR